MKTTGPDDVNSIRSRGVVQLRRNAYSLTIVIAKGCNFSEYEVNFPPPMVLRLAVARFTIMAV